MLTHQICEGVTSVGEKVQEGDCHPLCACALCLLQEYIHILLGLYLKYTELRTSMYKSSFVFK
jgi:hypothetical protein